MKKSTFKGDEFAEGEIALLENKYAVEVIRWDKEYGGWWYVQLKNKGMHYTRLLTKIK